MPLRHCGGQPLRLNKVSNAAVLSLSAVHMDLQYLSTGSRGLLGTQPSAANHSACTPVVGSLWLLIRVVTLGLRLSLCCPYLAAAVDADDLPGDEGTHGTCEKLNDTCDLVDRRDAIEGAVFCQA